MDNDFFKKVKHIASCRMDLELNTVPGDPLVDALIMTARAIVERDKKVEPNPYFIKLDNRYKEELEKIWNTPETKINAWPDKKPLDKV